MARGASGGGAAGRGVNRRGDDVERVLSAAERRLWAARLALFWERLWPALWPAVFFAGVFLCATLLGFWDLVSPWTHLLLLLLFFVVVAAELVNGFRNFRLPVEAEGKRRIERASGLRHRPLAALSDHLATGADDPSVQSLWERHRARMAATSRRLRIGLAKPDMARHDPLGLRVALFLALMVASVAGASEADRRLSGALVPDLSLLAPPVPAELAISVTPPPYTGQPPMFLAIGSPVVPGAGEDRSVPAGSALMARVHGGEGVPLLRLGDATTPFTVVDSSNFEIAETIESGDRVAVTQAGTTLGEWPIVVVPDRPPTVAFAELPSQTNRAALRIDYAAEDDYGVTRAEVSIQRGPEHQFRLPLGLGRVGTAAIQGKSFHDLTPHPWAGLPVSLTLEVSDAVGQIGISETIEMVLPQRDFRHPVARAIVDQRRKLALDPEKRPEVARALDGLSTRPEAFAEDLGVFLGLRVARTRLVRGRGETTIPEVQNLLWQIALAIEEGPLALAERSLRDAMQALMSTLSREDAGDAEIDDMVDALRQALDEYLAALADRALNQPGSAPPSDGRVVDSDELYELLDQARDLARTGSREAAQQLLSQLREFLENLQTGRLAGIPQDSAVEQSLGAMRDLESLIGEQEELLDQTFRQGGLQGGGQGSQLGGTGEQPEGGARSSATDQESLRQQLRDLMLDMADNGLPVPRELGHAEKSMGRASRDLNRERPRQATESQIQAIDQMQQAAQGMLESLMEWIGQSAAGAFAESGPFGPRRDPFGRRMGKDLTDDGSVHVPDNRQVQRSRAILKELYRRAGDRARPAIEREYIERLLRRF